MKRRAVTCGHLQSLAVKNDSFRNSKIHFLRAQCNFWRCNDPIQTQEHIRRACQRSYWDRWTLPRWWLFGWGWVHVFNSMKNSKQMKKLLQLSLWSIHCFLVGLGIWLGLRLGRRHKKHRGNYGGSYDALSMKRTWVKHLWHRVAIVTGGTLKNEVDGGWRRGDREILPYLWEDRLGANGGQGWKVFMNIGGLRWILENKWSCLNLFTPSWRQRCLRLLLVFFWSQTLMQPILLTVMRSRRTAGIWRKMKAAMQPTVRILNSKSVPFRRKNKTGNLTHPHKTQKHL